MREQSPSDVFLLSLNRCAEQDRFIPCFYERFLASSAEIRHKFRNTDFGVQNLLLLKSLRMISGAVAGERQALKELRERAETHDRRHLNIEPHLYDIWKAKLIETAREFDGLWDADIEAAWEKTLGHVINQMVRHY